VTGRIAVIDDEAPNRAYLQTLLGTAGFDVQARTSRSLFSRFSTS